MTFAHYFHPETIETIIPMDQLEFVGYSLPYYNRLRNEIHKSLEPKQEISLNSVSIEEYRKVHTDAYIDSILRASQGSSEANMPISGECYNLYYAVPGYEFGLGGLYSIIDLMKKGVLDRAYAFSMASHHAYPDHGHGYSLLNTLAVSVRYAQSVGFQKVLILDWDHHHGDGTQTIFENNENVCQISIHSAVDMYMAKQEVLHLGTTDYGKSVGHINIPVLAEDMSESFYYEELEMTGAIYRDYNCIKQLQIELEQIPFAPDIIFIFDGHDAHIEDCGAGVANFTTDDFRTLSQIAVDQSKKHHCPLVSIPGGGYTPKAAIAAALAHIEILSE